MRISTRGLSKAISVTRESGVRGLIRRLYAKMIRPLIRYWHTNHAWEGKVVEWMGNRTRIDGLTIATDSPDIATSSKAALLKGNYEAAERKLLKRYLPVDLPVVELGACIGVIACLTNRNLLSPQQHLVVEANPHLIPLLEKNRDNNGCKFKILNAAIAYGADSITFYLSENFIASSSDKGHEFAKAIAVPTCSLQSVAQSASLDGFGLICDIEGEEVNLVEYELPYLVAHVHWLLIETHPKAVGIDKISTMNMTLRDAGFDMIQAVGNVACYRNVSLQH